MVAGDPQVGDVFTIPCDAHRVGIGQVIATYGEAQLFLVVFESVLDIDEVPAKLADALAGEVRFLALSLDAKFYAGDWTIIGREPVRSDHPLPAYKVSVTTGDHIDVVDYSGTRQRRANRQEAQSLPFRKTVAPVRLERALRADLGLEPWLDAFEELRPHGITSKEVFG